MEPGSDNSVGSMSSDDFAPNASEPSVSLGVLSLVNVCHSLAHVKVGFFPLLDSLDLNSSLLFVSVSLSPLETQECAFDIESIWGLTKRFPYLTG